MLSGEGELACYGDQEILLDKVTGTGTGTGMINCQPSWGSAAAPPQGIIADGADGSHWVTVDDKVGRVQLYNSAALHTTSTC